MHIRNVLVYRILIVGLAAGVVFAVLDAFINANPVAQRLYAVYRPIARESINAPLGLAFDVISGIVMALLFVLLTPTLGRRWANRGIAFGLIAWFFRVAMGAASQTVMFRLPVAAPLYTLATGLVEMIILGLLYGAFLRSR